MTHIFWRLGTYKTACRQTYHEIESDYWVLGVDLYVYISIIHVYFYIYTIYTCGCITYFYVSIYKSDLYVYINI